MENNLALNNISYIFGFIACFLVFTLSIFFADKTPLLILTGIIGACGMSFIVFTFVSKLMKK